MFAVLVVAACCACTAALDVSVLQMQLQYGQVHTFAVNESVEYILIVPPSSGQQSYATLVHASVDEGSAQHVIITARQGQATETWVLPYEEENKQLHQLTRTLCPSSALPSSDCEEDSSSGVGIRLHVSTQCASSVELRVRVDLASDWVLAFDTPALVSVSQESPRVSWYRWRDGEQQARLFVDSEDTVCALLLIHNTTCPIAQTTQQVAGVGLRMTTMRSAAVWLPRSSYPLGFYVVAMVLPAQETCEPSETSSDWLLEEALSLAGSSAVHRDQSRTKTLTITVKAALTLTQYLVGGAAVLAFFLLFYVLFGSLLLMRDRPSLRRFFASAAVLVSPDASRGQSVTDATSPARRRRRGSTATYDSSDHSDTDTDDEDESQDNLRSTSTVVSPTGSVALGVGDDANVTTGGMTVPGNAGNGVGSPAEGGGGEDVVRPPAEFRDDALAQSQPDGSSGTAQGTPRRPFGLPAQLHLSALAKRRARVLEARAARYLHTTLIVAVFYALPVLQFVVAFQIFLNVSGSLDTCYYNFRCAHPVGGLSDWNHVLSNLGYMLLGALLVLQIQVRSSRRRKRPKDERYGIPAHTGLLSALGAGMMVVALLSSAYHICPNRLNFQFDTAFMYVLAVVSMVKMYQSRHPDVNARAHVTYAVLATLIFCVVCGVLGGGPLFWGTWSVLHVFTVLGLSLRIYYLGQFKLEKETLAEAARELRPGGTPLYRTRLLLVYVANLVNWAFAIYGLVTQRADFPSHVLEVLLANTLMYMVFYLVMKLVHGERLRWYAWCWLGVALAAWVPALFFFLSGSTDWSSTPAQSRELNQPCVLLDLYDYHDLWHMLSAVALYASFTAIMTWDDGLSAVPRTQIAVF